MSWLRRWFSRPAAEKTVHPAFAARLEALGFMRYATAEQAAEVKEELTDRGWAGIYAHDGRFFPADAEDLAEGGVAGFLESISPVLSALGVSAAVDEDGFSDNEYWLRIWGRRWVIYSADELASHPEGSNIWALATVRTFAMVNERLAEAGVRDRLYAVNGGNDLWGIFLTPEQLQAIHDYAGPVRGRPYSPVDERPGPGDVL
jgi:hypothetical protein